MASLEMELEQGEESLGDDILNLSSGDIQARTRLLENEVGDKGSVLENDFWTPPRPPPSYQFCT